MSAAVEVLDVMLWEKTGDRSAMGSGGPVVCSGWAEARKVARRWMARGGNFYVSIMAHEPPFSASRAVHVQGWDWFCATSGGAYWLHIDYQDQWLNLDAPDNIAAGSCIDCNGAAVGRHVLRGDA